MIPDMQTIIARIKSQPISDFNRATMLQYIDMLSLRNAKYTTIANSVELLIAVDRLVGKDFNRLNVQDIAQFTRNLDTYTRVSKNNKGKQGKLSDSSKQQRRLILKRILNMLKMHELADIIRIRNYHGQKLPESILSDDDVDNMLRYTTSYKETAIVSVLYESGCRIGELLSVNLKHLTFQQTKDNEIARMRVSGKTGPRVITLVSSVFTLHRWLDNHPYAKDAEAPLWVLDHKSEGIYPRLTPVVLRTLLTELADKAGVKKRVNPHAFRHARATRLAGYMTEQQMKAYLGWTGSSTMASIYVHLSGQDMENAVLKMHEEKNTQQTVNKATQTASKWCSECGTQLSPTSKFCSGCGKPTS